MLQIQTTALTTLIGAVIMFVAAIVIGIRLQHARAAALRPIQLFQWFFAFFGCFFLVMWLPNLLLTSRPADFPATQAWAYVVGHGFLYAAFTTIGLMLCSIVPRLAGKDRWVLAVALSLGLVTTVMSAATMIGGTQPAYNYQQSVVEYHVAPVVGAAIGLFAMLTILPAGVLFAINALRNPAQRLRSGLLGAGFILMTLAGPLHDIATNWQLLVIADITTILSVAITGLGVLYRFDQSLSAPATADQSSLTPEL